MPPVPARDRLVSAAAVAALHLALGWALLSGFGVDLARRPEEALAVFQVASDPPPQREEPEPAPASAERPEGEAAPPNLRAAPKPVVAPPPIVPLPPPPVAAAPVASVGSDLSVGAAERPGPGTGAGGVGQGRGAGGEGAGRGGGGEPARHLSGRIRNSDYPAAAVRARAEGGVTVALDIDDRGRVAGCRVAESSGNVDLDVVTCRLIVKRFRYAPARDASGRPVPDKRGWRQTWWLARP